MAINLQSTARLGAGHIKLLVYGSSGSGKTRLISTLPNPITLSAEGGLLSLAAYELPYVTIDNMVSLREAYTWLIQSDEATPFQTVCLDSISEIAEVVLTSEKKINKDPRKAYGEMADQMADLIRAFRDIKKHVYMSAKLDKTQDETAKMLYGPSMPGQKTGQAIPYFFDEVLALRIEKDSDGVTQRALMTDGDGAWLAKSRSGKLSPWEPPDLGQIIRKIGGTL